MATVKLQKYADAKGWTKQNLHDKIKNGVITQRSLVKKNDRNVGIIVEFADEDLRRNAKQFKAEDARTAGLSAGNIYGKVIGDDLTDNDDWLEDELQKDVLAKTKPKGIPKAKSKLQEIAGQAVQTTVVPPADSDPYERFRGAKTNKEELSARKLELEVAEMEGRVIDTETVRKRIVQLVTETKDNLGNLSGKLAPILVGITDVVEMETTLMKEINQACASLHKLGQTKWAEKPNED